MSEAGFIWLNRWFPGRFSAFFGRGGPGCFAAAAARQIEAREAPTGNVTILCIIR
jgi:hypothetical protein